MGIKTKEICDGLNQKCEWDAKNSTCSFPVDWSTIACASVGGLILVALTWYKCCRSDNEDDEPAVGNTSDASLRVQAVQPDAATEPRPRSVSVGVRRRLLKDERDFPENPFGKAKF